MNTPSILFAALRNVMTVSVANIITAEVKIPVEISQHIDLDDFDHPLPNRPRPRMVLIDPSWPDLDMSVVIKTIKRRGVPVAVALLSKNMEQAVAVCRWGASILFLDDPEENFMFGLRAVLSGRKYIPSNVADAALAADDSGIKSLTPKEISCLTYIARGSMMKEVAHHMKISPKTAETHRHNISRKLGYPTRAQLVALALREGLVTLDELELG